MIQARRVLRNTAMLGGARLIERASTVLLSFFVARVLFAPGLGQYATAMVVYELISTSAQMGAVNLLTREISKAPANTNRYLVHLGLMSVGVSIGLVLIFLAVLPHLGYSSGLTSSLYFVVLAIIPGTLSNLQEGVFVAHEKVEFVTYTTALAAAVNIAISLFLLTHGYGIVSLIVAFVLVQWTVAICYFFFIHRYIARLHLEFDMTFMQALYREMKVFAGMAVVGSLFARPEVVILSLVSTEAQIGFYSAALKVTGLVEYIAVIYVTNIFPILSRAYLNDKHQAQLIQNMSAKYLLAITLPLAAGLAILAEPIVNLIYGLAFQPAAAALRVLALDVPLAALFSLLWRLLVARGEQRLILPRMLIVTATELAVGYVLISNLAAVGAAINTPASSLFSVILLVLAVRRDGTSIPVFRSGWRFALAAVGMGILLLPLISYFGLWVLVPLGAAAYLLLVILLKAFSREDFDLFRTILPLRNATKVS